MFVQIATWFLFQLRQRDIGDINHGSEEGDQHEERRSDLQKPPKIYESSPDDEKRRNYGGVYVGLPSDMTTVAGSQSKSTDKD
ncbi:overexpressed in colon carcinoma 1 protein isoform X2 [Oncorhynchus keta]|uniref:overexpressed in colon carcinoma 1 protein isoform X2 n=1 Tax=Oncorhynchus keta TaxID=8018 RepID=UPI00227C5078|nr:overexpressed in colon carcinoma 1 protein isoform X2 [Oncorhynchus keta]